MRAFNTMLKALGAIALTAFLAVSPSASATPDVTASLRPMVSLPRPGACRTAAPCAVFRSAGA